MEQKEKKNTSAERTTRTAKKTPPAQATQATKKPAGERRVKMAETTARRAELSAQIMPFVFYVSALLVLLVLVLPDAGIVVSFLRGALCGLFSLAAFAIPVLLVLLGIFWRAGAGGTRVGWRFWCSAVIALLFSMIVHIVMNDAPVFSLPELYLGGIAYTTGGVIGGLCGSLFLLCFGRVISLVILCAVAFVLCLLCFGLTPNAVYHMIKGKAVEKHEAHVRRRDELAAYRAEQLAAAEAAAAEAAADGEQEGADGSPARGRKFDPDVDMSADIRREKKAATEKKPATDLEKDEIDKKIFDEVQRRTFERYGEQRLRDKDMSAQTSPAPGSSAASVPEKTSRVAIPPVKTDDGGLDLSSIFVDPDSIELLRGAEKSDRGGSDGYKFMEKNAPDAGADDTGIDPDFGVDPITGEVLDLSALRAAVGTVSDAGANDREEAPPPEPEYEFPPLSLLAEPKASSSADIDELKENAQRLIDTLRAFNVRTKISDVSHGPTITRYELTPESGTRVRAIANLADDIALSLAAPGVRIEAPIPGKAAVGVEVPNHVRENVYLRSLLENEAFTSSDSRLLTALGSDVAGAPVYCDISKMPHLLVAGATGMGKSVCINSIVVSMLYKAKPDEVRLIMIDPKKVEFGVYNRIPHLHVPVVNDPKKAAGTLSWAVGEMERRYEMIESVGVRNIQGYNEITASDPEKPFMPFMVIIIDELADLMMTAPDDVETSICRIAQMGRAAGMHLIIGTQRPSVDVITGLIKANIPSRISCKTSSQVDSRTIIDGVGAEKLLGRGDMLYAPVGVMKPQRVQGAFVSDAEVEKITDFLKGICPSPHYDEGAIEGIEEAARQCGTGKKGRTAEDGGTDAAPGGAEDPMLRQALELAVDSGKISTSLIQRRLSIGYGRAAKLIDRMEALGYVGAPDGPRPREVLITRQQFQELVLKDAFD